MNNSGASLIIRHGSAPQQEHEISADTTILGREAINEVVLFDPEVSRRHAQIIFQGGRYVIEDLGSTNGTFVNESRITVPTPLSNGDLIFPRRARPVPFWRNSLRWLPLTSERCLTEADPARFPASCMVTTSCRTLDLTGTL